VLVGNNLLALSDTGELVVETGRGLDHLPAVGAVETWVGGQ